MVERFIRTDAASRRGLVQASGDKRCVVCDKFIYTGILRPQETPTAQESQSLAPLEPTLRAAIESSARDDGWSALSGVGSMILKNNPPFDSRNYGFQKLGELVRKRGYLEVEEVRTADGSTNVRIFVRVKAA